MLFPENIAIRHGVYAIIRKAQVSNKWKVSLVRIKAIAEN